ncbi:protein TRIGALACTOSYLDIACYLGLYCEROL 4, chloroplastic isoform X3 [Lycium barbarum]|uniref:protein TRIGALACTOSYLDIACYLGLYCEROL 4, chloroplastic isoform X3 n=1 Tax=Lycium barbarum TaxID=112863 RepID=UPI00293E9091|nr:protein TRIGALACTOSYLDIACYLGLYCEROL 4, chloroplastic isoform X3 [Lycium barbarum]
MKKLRWAMDSGGFWELDLSTPITLSGQARSVPGEPLPLGLSRGSRLSRCQQIDFFQRFMAMPFVPSFSPNTGFFLQRVLSLPIGESWSTMLLGQLNVQKFVSSLRKNKTKHLPDSSWLQSIGRNFIQKSFYALGFSSELSLTPDDTLLISLDAYGDEKMPQKKAVLHHKCLLLKIPLGRICIISSMPFQIPNSSLSTSVFLLEGTNIINAFFPHHNLTMEAAWPGLFVDGNGSYWDVPFSLALDLASTALDSGASYHLFFNNCAGSPKQYEGQHSDELPPAALLPGFTAKGVASLKKNIDLWRSEASMLKMVQPYDIFLSNPHISASWILGAVFSAYLGDNSMKGQRSCSLQGLKDFDLRIQGVNSAVTVDSFASASLTAQHGNFQRLFLDLTRVNTRFDFPSGSKLLSGITSVAYSLYNSQEPKVEALQAICPRASLCFQQQIIGPFSFRVDSEIAIDLKKDWCLSVKNPVFAIEHALQVLWSAKAVAWYSPMQREFMVELRFFET